MKAHHVCYDCLSVVHENAPNCVSCGRTQPSGGWGLDPLIGLVLADRYRLEERLGEGGMASVYKAERTGSLGGHVAVKVLSPNLSRTVIAKRFEREARVVSRLSNPNVVRIYDFETFAYPVDGQPLYFIAMELVEGTPLSALLRQKKGQVHYLWALDVLRQTARGLVEAHDQGIVHRDLKPSNLMIVEQHRSTHVKILDFGIAAITDEGGEAIEKLTRTGLVTGTPDYMAPEQAMGKEIGPAADIYSLGVMAYQLFAGELPFSGETAMTVLTMRLTQDPPPLREKRPPPSLPEGVYDLVDGLLKRDPAERIPDAGALLDILAAFPSAEMAPGATPEQSVLDGYGTLTPHEGSPVVDQAAPTAHVPSVPPPSERRPRATGEPGAREGRGSRAGRTWLWVSLVVVLLGAGGGGGWWWWSQQQRTPVKRASAATSSTATSGGLAATSDPGPRSQPHPTEGPTSGSGDGEGTKGGAAAPAQTAPPAPGHLLLGHTRPALPGTRVAATAPVGGGRTLLLRVPSKAAPLNMPFPLAVEVNSERGPLVLRAVQAEVTLITPRTKVGTAQGEPDPASGRVTVTVPPRPIPGRYQIDLNYTLGDGASGRMTVIYDTADGSIATP